MNPDMRAAIRNKRSAYARLRAAGKPSKSQLRREYKAACKLVSQSVKDAVEAFETKMVDEMKRNGKDFHAYVNSQQAVPERIHALKDPISGELHTGGKDICRILNDTFHAVFTIEPPVTTSPLPSFKDRTSKVLDVSANELYDKYTVWSRLEKLDVYKSVGPDGIHPRVLKECAMELAVPLTAIYRRSHVDGRAPKLFKQANVVPIFKKGCRATASNYRPISLTSVPCKVQESIIHDAILTHLKNENLIAPEQHGFLPRKSCTTNLLECYEIMSEAMARGVPIDVIYLDFCKAFDIVPHLRLLHKLKAYGVGGQLLKWITDWLTTRKQRVVFGENVAEWKDVLSGVPQGSVLGPLLFVIFINDLVESLHNKMNMYADDSKILGKAGSAEDCKRLQEDIDKCVKWARTWLMKFNTAKCKVMHVGKGKKKSTHAYTMPDGAGITHTLEVTRVERDLGVLVSDDLQFGPQCKAAAAAANWKFGVLKKVFSSRSRRLWSMLWKAHIRPHLEHAIQAWSPHHVSDIHILERVQRRLTKHMDGMKGLSYEQRLDELGWTTLERRRRRGDLIFTYQALHERAIVNLDWRWAQPLSQIEGPASAVRSNGVRVNPPIYKACKQRSHFLTSRVDAPLRALPDGLMRKPTVNAFKNAFDKIEPQHHRALLQCLQ